MIIETNSPEETFALGRQMGGKALAGQIYCLNGDLGTGKTVFTQGFAAGLGIAGPVNSPTFTILRQYESGRIPLYHFDVYRMEEEEELYEIGFDELLRGDGVCLVEWAERFPEAIPGDAVEVRIEKDPEKGFDYRRITVSPGGAADIDDGECRERQEWR